MEQKNFTCSITANISAEEAMAKISQVPEWWGVAFTGSAEKQGDQFVVKMGGESFFNFTVTQLIPGKRVVWLVDDCYMPWYTDKKEWAGTKMIYELSEKNSGTTLTFTHEGLTPNVECYKDCEPGWTHWIRTSLLAYFNTGKGQLKTKKNVSYSNSIEVSFDPAFVFGKITEVANWWPDEFEGESAKLNDEFILRNGDVHISRQKITEFVPNEKLVWLTTESIRKTDNYEWTGAEFIFELLPGGGNTTLNFTYRGPVFENEQERLAQVCDMVIKERLHNFITSGKA